MPRKDYIKFARVLNKRYETAQRVKCVDLAYLMGMINELTCILAEDNKNFDHQRFEDAVYTGKGL